MKKLILGLIITLLSGNLSFGQNNEILQDKDFLDYVLNEYNTFLNIKDLKKIEEFSNIDINNLSEIEFNLLSKSLGFTDSKEFSIYLYNQDLILKRIENKYQISKLSHDELLKTFNACIEILIPISTEVNSNKMSCNTRYNWCFAGAMAASVGAQLACFSMDVATFGATWLCHAAALVLEASMLMGCQASYEDCIGL